MLSEHLYSRPPIGSPIATHSRPPRSLEMTEATDLRGKLGLEPERKNTVSGFNHMGFLRTYSDGSELRPFHLEMKFQRSDRELGAVLKASHELVAIEIMFDYLDPSNIARTRLDDALCILYRALDVKKRAILGIQRTAA